MYYRWDDTELESIAALPQNITIQRYIAILKWTPPFNGQQTLFVYFSMTYTVFNMKVFQL